MRVAIYLILYLTTLNINVICARLKLDPKKLYYSFDTYEGTSAGSRRVSVLNDNFEVQSLETTTRYLLTLFRIERVSLLNFFKRKYFYKLELQIGERIRVVSSSLDPKWSNKKVDHSLTLLTHSYRSRLDTNSTSHFLKLHKLQSPFEKANLLIIKFLFTPDIESNLARLIVVCKKPSWPFSSVIERIQSNGFVIKKYSEDFYEQTVRAFQPLVTNFTTGHRKLTQDYPYVKSVLIDQFENGSAAALLKAFELLDLSDLKWFIRHSKRLYHFTYLHKLMKGQFNKRVNTDQTPLENYDAYLSFFYAVIVRNNDAVATLLKRYTPPFYITDFALKLVLVKKEWSMLEYLLNVCDISGLKQSRLLGDLLDVRQYRLANLAIEKQIGIHSFGNYPVYNALKTQHVQIEEMILIHGNQARGQIYRDVLKGALVNGDFGLARLAVRRGASLELNIDDIKISLGDGSGDLILYLLKNGARIKQSKRTRLQIFSEILCFAIDKNHEKLIGWFKEKIRSGQMDNILEESLLAAVKADSIHVVRSLVEDLQASVNYKDDRALVLATDQAYIDIATYLMEKGCSVKASKYLPLFNIMKIPFKDPEIQALEIQMWQKVLADGQDSSAVNAALASIAAHALEMGYIDVAIEILNDPHEFINEANGAILIIAAKKQLANIIIHLFNVPNIDVTSENYLALYYIEKSGDVDLLDKYWDFFREYDYMGDISSLRRYIPSYGQCFVGGSPDSGQNLNLWTKTAYYSVLDWAARTNDFETMAMLFMRSRDCEHRFHIILDDLAIERAITIALLSGHTDFLDNLKRLIALEIEDSVVLLCLLETKLQNKMGIRISDSSAIDASIEEYIGRFESEQDAMTQALMVAIMTMDMVTASKIITAGRLQSNNNNNNHHRPAFAFLSNSFAFRRTDYLAIVEALLSTGENGIPVLNLLETISLRQLDYEPLYIAIMDLNFQRADILLQSIDNWEERLDALAQICVRLLEDGNLETAKSLMMHWSINLFFDNSVLYYLLMTRYRDAPLRHLFESMTENHAMQRNCGVLYHAMKERKITAVNEIIAETILPTDQDPELCYSVLELSILDGFTHVTDWILFLGPAYVYRFSYDSHVGLYCTALVRRIHDRKLQADQTKSPNVFKETTTVRSLQPSESQSNTVRTSVPSDDLATGSYGSYEQLIVMIDSFVQDRVDRFMHDLLYKSVLNYANPEVALEILKMGPRQVSLTVLYKVAECVWRLIECTHHELWRTFFIKALASSSLSIMDNNYGLLRRAVSKGDDESVRIMVEACKSISSTPRSSLDRLVHAIIFDDSSSLSRHLVALKQMQDEGQMLAAARLSVDGFPFALAAALGHTDQVIQMIQAGGVDYIKNDALVYARALLFEWTPILKIMERNCAGHLRISKWSGASYPCRQLLLNAAMLSAIELDLPELVMKLFDKKADPSFDPHFRQVISEKIKIQANKASEMFSLRLGQLLERMKNMYTEDEPFV